MANFGMCFSKDFKSSNPLNHIGKKLPVYLRLFELCKIEGWKVFAVTKKTYTKNGKFNGVWAYKNNSFEKVEKTIKIDLVFDWTNGLEFPPEVNDGLRVVDCREFKELCNSKWLMYEKLQEYMAKTFWIKNRDELVKNLPQIKTDLVVFKPLYGLKGRGIYILPKKEAANFEFRDGNNEYLMQEFIDTSNGISGIAPGLHDLRVVIINKKVVWCHVREPKKGKLKANVGQGGSLTEIDYSLVPPAIKDIVNKLSIDFYKDYDNPLYSLDFGIGKDNVPKLFEINDQIGFPTWEMKASDIFLKELVKNFKSKI